MAPAPIGRTAPHIPAFPIPAPHRSGVHHPRHRADVGGPAHAQGGLAAAERVQPVRWLQDPDGMHTAGSRGTAPQLVRACLLRSARGSSAAARRGRCLGVGPQRGPGHRQRRRGVRDAGHAPPGRADCAQAAGTAVAPCGCWHVMVRGPRNSTVPVSINRLKGWCGRFQSRPA